MLHLLPKNFQFHTVGSVNNIKATAIQKPKKIVENDFWKTRAILSFEPALDGSYRQVQTELRLLPNSTWTMVRMNVVNQNFAFEYKFHQYRKFIFQI